jgi:RimJ/RimL family protein N-acetyltransferase
MITDNILRGRKIRLTAITKEDIKAISHWYEDAGFSRLFDATPAVPKSQNQLANLLEEQEKNKDIYLFAIRPIDDNVLLGYVELDGFLWAHQNCWLSIGLGDRKNWGKGYGREAMELILRFVFHELNLHRIQLTVFSYNERAVALYENLGFTREGVYREHLQRDGQRHDMYLYGLLRREWSEGQAAKNRD